MTTLRRIWRHFKWGRKTTTTPTNGCKTKSRVRRKRRCFHLGRIMTTAKGQWRLLRKDGRKGIRVVCGSVFYSASSIPRNATLSVEHGHIETKKLPIIMWVDAKCRLCSVLSFNFEAKYHFWQCWFLLFWLNEGDKWSQHFSNNPNLTLTNFRILLHVWK